MVLEQYEVSTNNTNICIGIYWIGASVLYIAYVQKLMSMFVLAFSFAYRTSNTQ